LFAVSFFAEAGSPAEWIRLVCGEGCRRKFLCFMQNPDGRQGGVPFFPGVAGGVRKKGGVVSVFQNLFLKRMVPAAFRVAGLPCNVPPEGGIEKQKRAWITRRVIECEIGKLKLSAITYLPLTGSTTGAGATGSGVTCCCCCCWQETKAAAVRARIAIFFIIILLVLMLFDAPD
jgi:hypothetical protein